MSAEWIDFLVTYIEAPRDDLSVREQKILLMTYYTLYDTAPECSVVTFMKHFFVENPDISEELRSLLLYNKEQLDHMPKALLVGETVPLELHALYSVNQILAALEVHTEDKLMSFREGVKYVKGQGCDVFFVTLNKNEKDYQKTTMYKDYAISESLFHWQSQ